MAHHLVVELTDEQARLYLNSPTFKTGADDLLQRVVATYLEGLAAKAEAADADREARDRERMGAWRHFRD